MYQRVAQSQKELPLMGQTQAQVAEIDSETVAAWSTEQEAYRQCVLKHPAKLTQGEIAENIGMKRANFTAILNSDYGEKLERGLTRTRQIRLQQECRCFCIDQWADLYAKGMLNCQRSNADRKAALLAEIKRLEAETDKLEGVA